MLAWKKRADEAWGISRLATSAAAFFFASSSPSAWFFFLESALGGASREGWWVRGGCCVQACVFLAWGRLALRRVGGCWGGIWSCETYR